MSQIRAYLSQTTQIGLARTPSSFPKLQGSNTLSIDNPLR